MTIALFEELKLVEQSPQQKGVVIRETPDERVGAGGAFVPQPAQGFW
ncbi:MAG: hypothetical protein ACRD2X_14090 [Vicinamibacteraceae bacterium]